MSETGRLTLSAHAKINLSLEVLGRRADGYHDLLSVMQTVSLADTLTVEPAPTFHFTCSDAALSGSDNLVLRAAHALHKAFGMDRGARMHLVKRIPSPGGLGGGSSDAAAAIVGLDRLWGLETSCAQLTEVAAAVGSDVPFFLTGGTALVEGRGERVTALPHSVGGWYLLVTPPVLAPTPAIFSRVTPSDWTSGETTRELAARLRAGRPGRIGQNGLQRALFEAVPDAAVCFERVAAVTGGPTFVSGSGPTIVGAFNTRSEAEEAQHRLADTGYRMQIVTPCIPHPWETPCRKYRSS